MKIRSITFFFDPQAGEPDQLFGTFRQLADRMISELSERGYEVQTTRLSSTPFPTWCTGPDDLQNQAAHLEHLADQHGFSYLSLGPALPEFAWSYSAIPSAIAASKRTFFSGVMATPATGVHPNAVRACAGVIAACANITPDGFANLRFTALSNMKPDGPFFPGSFHEGSQIACALAMECADEVVTTFSSASNLDMAGRNLLAHLDAGAVEISEILIPLCQEAGVIFKGFDFSPAPFPQDCCSLGGGIELVGAHLGMPGALAAAAVIAAILDEGRWQKTGFNGLMLPVLEDSILAARSGHPLEWKDLLMYSAVCGAGLDTVPLPGDADVDTLTALLMDVAVLALRLNKPLTARLMPVPGKQAGEITDYQFDYFANGAIMDLPKTSIDHFLTQGSPVTIRPRR